MSLIPFIRERIKRRKADAVVFAAATAFFLGSGIYFLCTEQIRNALLSILFIAIPLALLIVEKYLRINFPTVFLIIFFLVPIGCILGSCYDVYSAVPWFDTVLHTISGFIFACLGFGLFAKLTPPNNRKSFLACFIFGFVFSMAIAALWELFEYACTLFGFADMQEDTMIDGFMSYLLSGTHSAGVLVEDIAQTIIFFGDGQKIVLDGYLDIGLIDTMVDIFVCFIGAVVYCIIIGIAWFKCKKLSEQFLPSIREETEAMIPDQCSETGC